MQAQITQWLNQIEAAEHLNVHRVTVARMIEAGVLPAIRFGRVYRVPLSALLALAQNGAPRRHRRRSRRARRVK